MTVGGDRPDYSGDVATSTADITTFKILINITLSTEDAAMMMMDIKNYYLGTPLPRFEYMKMLWSCFPEEIVQKYNLNALAVDGWVYIEIQKGMYGWNKRDYSPANYCKLVWHHSDITQHATPRDSGCIRPSQSLSLSSWTISQLSTRASNMQSISGTPYCDPMS
jgi:hypothetical protein